MTWAEGLLYFLFLFSLVIYGLAMLFIFAYGLVQWQLFWAYVRRNKAAPQKNDNTPKVSVQLPVYNEGLITCRLIDAACQMDYPNECLEIQVLDDSTDDSLNSTAERVRYWKGMGMDIVLIHRSDRHGFKAGALKEGLAMAKGDLIAIFDADFIPGPDFLKKCLPHFEEKGLPWCKLDGRISTEKSLYSHWYRHWHWICTSASNRQAGNNWAYFSILTALRVSGGKWLLWMPATGSLIR
jgi:cellulose synthase/poly-beta-1,6-N-acetylglucosamine synthase-like glycosyltransferase